MTNHVTNQPTETNHVYRNLQPLDIIAPVAISNAGSRPIVINPKRLLYGHLSYQFGLSQIEEAWVKRPKLQKDGDGCFPIEEGDAGQREGQ